MATKTFPNKGKGSPRDPNAGFINDGGGQKPPRMPKKSPKKGGSK